jgi:hypothetical protein
MPLARAKSSVARPKSQTRRVQWFLAFSGRVAQEFVQPGTRSGFRDGVFPGFIVVQYPLLHEKHEIENFVLLFSRQSGRFFGYTKGEVSRRWHMR